MFCAMALPMPPMASSALGVCVGRSQGCQLGSLLLDGLGGTPITSVSRKGSWPSISSRAAVSSSSRARVMLSIAVTVLRCRSRALRRARETVATAGRSGAHLVKEREADEGLAVMDFAVEDQLHNTCRVA